MLAERSDDALLLLVLLHCCTCLSLLFTSAAECCAGIVDALDVAASIGQLRSAASEGAAEQRIRVATRNADPELLILAAIFNAPMRTL